MFSLTKRKIVLAILGIILFSPQAFVFANMEINEVMYDLKSGSDDGREWVELHNNSDKVVDLTTFKFFEGDTNHKMVLKQGDAKVPTGGYALVVSDYTKFKIDYPNLDGAVFDSTFSLSNTGETIAIKDGDSLVDQYSYTSGSGGGGNGNSLQKVNGAWTGAVPTPNAENKITVIPKVPSPPKATQSKEVAFSKSPEPRTPEAIAPESSTTDDFSKTDVPSGRTAYLFPAIFGIFLILASLGVFFIRKSGRETPAGDDFELLEE